jgi:vanillate O-demethylase monooxygenase subunit
MFVADSWYAAAWADDLGRKLLPRVILNRPFVFYRKADGAPVALEDRCAHRRMPISAGNLVGDDVQCLYHGLMYRPDGACFHVPGQSRVPPGMGVRSYPCVERHQLVWLWPGDPAQADPARIPRFDWLDDPARGKTGRYMKVAANYLLLVDNLLDLSHLAYVHTRTVGNTAVGEQANVTTEVNADDSIRVMRWMTDVPATSTYGQFGKYDGNIDRWQISLWRPPSFFWVDNGSCATGTGATRDNRTGEKTWSFQVCHAITPETETTTHYFYRVTNAFRLDSAAAWADWVRQVNSVIDEDVAVFEAQQRVIDLDPAAPNGEINADKGLIAARRIVARLAAAEARPAE